MNPGDRRLDRSIQFFGAPGQERLQATTVGIVGIGGVGTHVVRQLALLRIGALVLVDAEELDETNLNRYVGVRHDDPVPGTPKVNIGARIAGSIDPKIQVVKVQDSFISAEAMTALKGVTHLFGCVDKEGLRLILTEFCAAYRIPYIDVATEIVSGDRVSYGGRVCIAWDGDGCAVCMNVLDQLEVQHDLAGERHQRDEEAIYGVQRSALGRSGPSVVCINGVVASLAVTEFMLGVTGIRRPERLLTYRGDLGGVVLRNQDAARPGCYYCEHLRGQGDAADLLRYARERITV